MKNRYAFLALALPALFSQTAFAEPATSCCRDNIPNWYAGISGSAVFLQPIDYSHDPAASFADNQSFKTGFGIGGSVGYRIYPNIRGELEIMERISDVGSDTSTTQLGSGESTLRSTAYMANAYYDLHNESSFTPYLGTGIGAIDTHTNRGYFSTDPVTQAKTYSKSLQDWALGYQFMAGVNYEITSGVTPFEISLGYRYVTSDNDKVTLAGVNGTTSFTTSSHNVELGGKIFF